MRLKRSRYFYVCAFVLCFLELHPAPLPRVKILATGGTIANTPEGRIAGADVVRSVPPLERVARIEVEEITRINSTDLTLDLWLKLARRINQIFAEDRELAGIVVTHGTNTVEETAYFLNLVVKSDKPVVLTAAQRMLGSLSSDGPKNLLDAVRVAASDQSRGKGVLVTVNDMIISAREVVKNVSHRVEAFNLQEMGNLGLADRDGIFWYGTPTRRHTVSSEFDVEKIDELPRVEIVYSYAGADGKVVDALINSVKPQGLVVAGFATGNSPEKMREALDRARQAGILVVMSRRSERGRVSAQGPAAEHRWVTADNLSPQKARILLMLALTRTRDPKVIQGMFGEY
ncbi:MAG: asparaginase [Acidobacteria bacterium]|nr:asparaginase [Acidobacteriota bacterium]